jgi:hypothetical protein
MTIINGTLLHGLKKEEQVFLGLYFKIQNIPKEVVVILKIKQLKSFGRTGGTDPSKISKEMMAGH